MRILFAFYLNPRANSINSRSRGSRNGPKSLSVINEVNNVAYHQESGGRAFNGSLVLSEMNEICGSSIVLRFYNRALLITIKFAREK